MQIKLRLSDFSNQVEFLILSGAIYNREPGEIMTFAKPIKLKFENFEDGMLLQPTFTVRGGTELLQSLRDALDNLGVPSNRYAKVEGLLEAQKAHLEDMRKLVFKHKV